MINLRPNQTECYNMGLNLDKFLISAKCRFGKTWVASKLVSEGWNCHTTIIMSGKDVRSEWNEALIKGFDPEKDKIIYTNSDLNSIDFNSIPIEQRVVVFVSLQKAGRNIDSSVELLNSETDDDDSEQFDYSPLSNIALIQFVNNRVGTTALVLDEAHFAEQTDRSQTIINSFNHIDKVLYLTATPYTYSLRKQFTDTSMIYTYSYKDEMEEVANGTFDGDYTPVKMNWFLPDLTSCIGNSGEGSSEWNEVFNNNIDVLVSKMISCISKRNKRNFIIFVNKCAYAHLLKTSLSLIPNTNVEVIAGNSGLNNINGESLSVRAENWYRLQNTRNINNFNFLISCGKLGTGSSVPAIDGVIFLRRVNNLATLEQYSARAITPNKNFYRNCGIKDECDVYLFNRYNELKLMCEYITEGSKDKNDKTDCEKDTTGHTKELFDEFIKHCPIYIERDVGMVELSYENFLSANYISYSDDQLFDDIIDSDIVRNLPFVTEGFRAFSEMCAKHGVSTYAEFKEKAKTDPEVRKDFNRLVDLRKELSIHFKNTLDQLDDLAILNIDINSNKIEFNDESINPFADLLSDDDTEDDDCFSNFKSIVDNQKLTMEFMNYIKDTHPVVFYKFYYTKHLNSQV